MSKYYGEIGVRVTSFNDATGLTETTIKRINRSGDVGRRYRSLNTSDKIIDDVDVSNQITILADPFFMTHYSDIVYVTWHGVKWKAKTIEVQEPNLIIGIGGVYNEVSS